MDHSLPRVILDQLDAAAAAALWPLALWILVSGVDDLVICGVWLWLRWRSGRLADAAAALAVDAPAPCRRVAIFVPLWKEAGVIRGMLEHNLAAIDYPHYDFFVGAYPNDPPTVRAVKGMANRSPRVHLALCPHDGPTSKADCLNWIYQRMLLFERENGVRFDLVVTHDAEDLVHPAELRILDHFAGEGYGMIQTPVLPLPTPLREWTHGLYCDDFAEFHGKDLPVRWFLGGFIPSSGVGTAFRRDALEALAESDSNLIFRPDCLTEDYENGYRVRKLGFRQLFVPIAYGSGPPRRAPIATREFFPKAFGAAQRQRTRWVTGIALQGWSRNGWGSGGWREAYWFWRDRKGLAGNPASLAANVVFLYGLLTWMAAQVAGAGTWGLGERLSGSSALALLPATAAVGLVLALARAICSAAIYGWGFAAWSPARSVTGNLLNTLATAAAVNRFARAAWLGQPLVWLKTEHAYPNLAALETYKQPLEAILVSMGSVTAEEIAEALRTAGATPLGEHLVALGRLGEDELLAARMLRHSLPGGELGATARVPAPLARLLPPSLVGAAGLVPVALEDGVLRVACTDLPADSVIERIRAQTRLAVEFHLTTQTDLKSLRAAAEEKFSVL